MEEKGKNNNWIILFIIVIIIFIFIIGEDILEITYSGSVSYANPSSNQTQAVLTINTPTPVNFTTLDGANLINLDSTKGENFSVVVGGQYSIGISAIFQTAIANRHAQIWLQVQNSSNQMQDVINSNTRQEFVSINTEQVVSVPFIITLSPQQKFRLMWASDSTSTMMVATGKTSYSPATPSIIMTVHRIG